MNIYQINNICTRCSCFEIENTKSVINLGKFNIDYEGIYKLLSFNFTEHKVSSSKALLEEVVMNRSITKVCMKDEVYYCGQKVLLDQDKNILFIAVPNTAVTDARLFIHYSILRDSNTLYNYIRKKLIPVFITEKQHVEVLYHLYKVNSLSKPSINIGDL